MTPFDIFIVAATCIGVYASYRWMKGTFESWLSGVPLRAPKPSRTTPSSPAESLAATQKIAVANRILMKIAASLQQGYSYDNYVATSHELHILARIINESRALKPSVTLGTDEGKKDLDQLMAEACYLEACNLRGLAENWPPSGPYTKLTRDYAGRVTGSRQDEQGTLKERRKKHADALPPIEKAIRFQPWNIKYHTEKVRILFGMNDRNGMRAAADAALRLDPANLDLLTFREL